MVIENINEVPHINLDLQKFPNITDKKANKNQIRTNIWSNAPYGSTWPIPWKKCFFSGIIRKCSRVKQVEPWSWKYCSRQRYLVCICQLLFLNHSDPRQQCFCKLRLSWELGSSIWKLWACWLQRRTGVLKETVFFFQPSTKSSWVYLISFLK